MESREDKIMSKKMIYQVKADKYALKLLGLHIFTQNKFSYILQNPSESVKGEMETRLFKMYLIGDCKD